MVVYICKTRCGSKTYFLTIRCPAICIFVPKSCFMCLWLCFVSIDLWFVIIHYVCTQPIKQPPAPYRPTPPLPHPTPTIRNRTPWVSLGVCKWLRLTPAHPRTHTNTHTHTHTYRIPQRIANDTRRTWIVDMNRSERHIHHHHRPPTRTFCEAAPLFRCYLSLSRFCLLKMCRVATPGDA